MFVTEVSRWSCARLKTESVAVIEKQHIKNEYGNKSIKFERQQLQKLATD